MLTANRKRIEEIKQAELKKKNLKRLSDWYHDGELGDELYELAFRLIESSFEELSGKDKKVLKSLNALLSNKISISTFQRDVELIKGLEELPRVKPEGEEERIKEEEKERISALRKQAQKLSEEKRYADAIAKWQDILKLEPANREALEGIKEAKRVFEELDEQKRKIAELKITAQYLYDEGKYPAARDKWKDVLALDPEDPRAAEGIKRAEAKIEEERIREEEEKQKRIAELSSRRSSGCHASRGSRLYSRSWHHMPAWFSRLRPPSIGRSYWLFLVIINAALSSVSTPCAVCRSHPRTRSEL